MKTITFLISTCFLGSVICYAAATPDPGQTVLSTNVGLGIGQSEALVTAAPITAPRLSLELPQPESVPRSGPILSMLKHDQIPRPWEVTRHPLSIDSAERVNVHAMRDYREKWDGFAKSPGSLAPPVLYPSRVHRTFEAAR